MKNHAHHVHVYVKHIEDKSYLDKINRGWDNSNLLSLFYKNNEVKSSNQKKHKI
jgi:hypothetical protein